MATDEPGPVRQRIALGVEYDGTHYHGWQIQPHASSIQAELNKAVASVADAPVEVVGAGRTDTGVHASGQVAHFDSAAERSRRSWLLGINTRLPRDICVTWVEPVSADFHARFSAVYRSYRYVILNQPVRSALERDRVWWLHQELNAGAMHEAARVLLGTHDFSCFRAAACQAHTPVRTITDLRVYRDGACVIIECRANAFLHHMVRNLVGTLVRVGKGEATGDWVAAVLASRDRRRAGMTAPASGLTLTGVEYPPELLPAPRISG